MFQKILIANRGEIACRVIATARALGVKTVAVHSEADADARHVAMADQAVGVGPPAAADSYLVSERIIAAAVETGAEAIHPGYGFLSENADFVEAVEAAGLVFIGPPATAMRAMGLKDAAKALMVDAGVPVVRGYHGAVQDADRLAAEAAKIGYPVVIKARAGGGGKGMRLVEDSAAFTAALDSARREAAASFGDPACLVEKCVAQPRHIEIQVFGDAHGTIVHLFERDCSLQRRHQKVIEEAPAPNMPDELRAAMGAAAVKAARAIGYQGAGTIEFIVDGSGPLRPDGFWFMEMNTRLQVEHPVSEAIVGLDFVELQLRIAAGEPLPFTQDDLSIDGWAFEARVYAEDCAKGFLPATGPLERLVFPEGAAFAHGPLRIDSGVGEGDAISPWYDPMIAKVIVHGPSRAAALTRLAAALDRTQIVGCTTNLAFLSALARHDGVRRGAVDTGLIARDVAMLTDAPDPPAAVVGAAAVAAVGLLPHAAPARSADPWDRLVGWRHWTPAEQFCRLRVGERDAALRVGADGAGRFTIHDGDATTAIALSPKGGERWRLTAGGVGHEIAVATLGDRVVVFMDGRAFVFEQPDPLARTEGEQAGGDVVRAPMPGLVRVVSATPGLAVAKGDALMVLEAMKMEHTLTAPRDGVVAGVAAAAGDQVVDGAPLLTLEPHDG